MAKENNPYFSKEHGSNKYWTFYCKEANISSCVIDGLKCFLFADTFLICVYHYFDDLDEMLLRCNIILSHENDSYFS